MHIKEFPEGIFIVDDNDEVVAGPFLCEEDAQRWLDKFQPK